VNHGLFFEMKRDMEFKGELLMKSRSKKKKGKARRRK
jgi:hypothetical protein